MTEHRPDTVTTLLAMGLDREAARHGIRALQADASTTPQQSNGEPMDPMTQLAQLGPVLGGVFAGLEPEHLDAPTPCADFTVRGVLEHMIGGATAFAAAYRGETPGEPDLSDPLRGIGDALGGLMAAMTAPGALDQMVATPFGQMPGDAFARIVVLDGLVHGWDLATATGQTYEPSAELVAAVDGLAHEILDPLRDGQTFGAAVEAAPDASPIERLAAYTGRRPLAA